MWLKITDLKCSPPAQVKRNTAGARSPLIYTTLKYLELVQGLFIIQQCMINSTISSQFEHKKCGFCR